MKCLLLIKAILDYSGKSNLLTIQNKLGSGTLHVFQMRITLITKNLEEKIQFYKRFV